MELENAINNFLSGYLSTCRRSAKTKQAYEVDLEQLRSEPDSGNNPSIMPTT